MVWNIRGQIEEQVYAVVNKRYVLYLSCILNLLREIMKIYERGGEKNCYIFNNQLYLVILWNFLIDQTTDFKNIQLKINVKYNLTFRDNTSFSEQRTIS